MFLKLKQRPFLLIVNLLCILFALIWLILALHVNSVANKWIYCPIAPPIGYVQTTPCIDISTPIPSSIKNTINNVPLYNSLFIIGVGLVLTVLSLDLLVRTKAKSKDRLEQLSYFGIILIPWLSFIFTIFYLSSGASTYVSGGVVNFTPGKALYAIALVASVVLGATDLLILRHAIKLAHRKHHIIWLGINVLTLIVIVLAVTLMSVIYAQYL